ncbi:contractile injection system tape measure protein, partial [Enterobacteriaceae bacterium LUAb1]
PLPGSRIRDNGEDRAVDAQRPAPLSGSRIQDNGEDRAVDAQRPAPLPGSRIRDNGENRAVDAQRPAPLPGSRIQDNGEARPTEAYPVNPMHHTTRVNRYRFVPQTAGPPGQPYQDADTLDWRIGNAGVVMLWPLLPQFFAQLELTEKQHFISESTRWQAIACLDWLVWGDPNPQAGRLMLNQLLCGIAPESAPLASSPLSERQRQWIDSWLTTTGQQLPGWQKLSLTDMRQLFLQRSGEILNRLPSWQLSVKPEAYDFLLRELCWPVTLVSLPWLEQPLTIIWPLNGLTG